MSNVVQLQQRKADQQSSILTAVILSVLFLIFWFIKMHNPEKPIEDAISGVVIDFGDKVVVLSEKGLASYNKKDGSRAYASDKIKGVDFFYEIGGNYFLRDQRNSKNVIYGINMTNGDTKGSVQSKGKGGSPQYGSGIDITDDGEFIFAFKGRKVEKIKVNN